MARRGSGFWTGLLAGLALGAAAVLVLALVYPLPGPAPAPEPAAPLPQATEPERLIGGGAPGPLIELPAEPAPDTASPSLVPVD